MTVTSRIDGTVIGI